MATTTSAPSTQAGGHASGGEAPMTHRQIMEALSGLLLGMFVAILSSTIVSNALPQIITDLGGGQSAYTWVVTAALLSMTATTPLWGKLADLFSKKLLVQIALVIYVAGSVVAGLSQNTGMLIACRVVQGIGVGGLTALSQIILAAMIAPRERGRYSGYLGATFAVATVGGPLLGGVITDTDWLGWRWCFYVGVPFAIIALLVLQKTLKLPVAKRQVKVDWAGALVISAAVSLLLVWVTFAGDKYDWMSWQTAAMVGGSIVLGALFVFVESKASEPIIPLRLFRNRTITLASLASLFVGVAMFAGTVFFSQYFQLARNESPTMSGVLTIPMIAGLFVSSTVSGMVITKTGRWKAWLVSGGVLVTGGLGLLGTIRYDTEYWHIAVFMAVMGLGLGMMMQNLVLCTQNQVDPADLGSASSVVTFFRSLGGAIGVSALGAVLAHRVTHYVQDGLADLGPKAAAAGAGSGGSGGGIPDMDSLPAPIRTVMESAYGHGVADVFLYSAPFALLAFLVTLFIKEVALKSAGGAAAKTTSEEQAAPAPTAAVTPVADGTAVTDVTAVAPVSTGLTVSGTVRTAEGTHVPGATVTLISLGGQQLGRSVVRDEDGYAFDAPGAGSYVLIASADGFQPQASTVVVNDGPLTHDVLLTGTSGLTGSVTAAEGGAPVDGAMVVITDVRGEVLASGKSGADGGYAFAELVPGPVTVAVTAAGYRPQALPVEIGGLGATRLDVALAAGAVVQGTVRAGLDHRPLADARVTLVDAAGNVKASATTDADGAYGFADLDAGEYTLIATGYPPVAGRLTVTGAGVDGHDIELAHPGE
ncbi:DHA2 family efflux MFS transporter permease subunit [Streptomyces sp. ISL-36]|uniref:MFS transporter n=1 Tax=Streptomyces sp. ISL-36 TaxID=2819182 RepID=UPI001BE8CD35|nr:MFS transporter [Streptomyces sp. ISL-36]MBT2441133.1 DHA2 family efflux MFS transporter permease subunit [Streptomyces sp. ISL-36]